MYNNIEQHTIIELPEGNVTCEFSPDFPCTAVIHCDIHEWSHSKFKMYLDIWDGLIEQMRAKGIKELIMSARVDDKKLVRFALMFGFEIEHDIIIDNEEHIVMKLELV